jgi:hypothetical protein
MTAGTPGAPSPGCDKSGIGFSSPLSGWIAGDCDGPLVLQHTVDGGRRWSFVRLTPAATSAQPSYGGDTFPPVFFGPARGVIAAQLDSAGGLRDAFYATANGGVTWTLHRPPLAVGGPAFPLSTDDWFAAGGRTLAITTDAGATWSQIPASIVFGYGEPDTLDFATPLIGWTVRPAAGCGTPRTEGGRGRRHHREAPPVALTGDTLSSPCREQAAKGNGISLDAVWPGGYTRSPAAVVGPHNEGENTPMSVIRSAEDAEAPARRLTVRIGEEASRVAAAPSWEPVSVTADTPG